MANVSFEAEVRALVEKRKLSLELITKRIVFDVFSRVIMKTPVDTGRLRANWVVSVGDVPKKAVNESKMDPSGVTPDGSGSSATKSEVLGELGKQKLAGTVVWLTNSLPYAYPIEYGHSRQAPQGMVRLSVAEVKHNLSSLLRSSGIL